MEVVISSSNSVLVKFGDNAVLRIPKTLVPASMILKNPHQPIESDQLSMTFLYPDMAQLPEYQGSWEQIATKEGGRDGWALAISVQLVEILKVGEYC